jgi:hypothetical protein
MQRTLRISILVLGLFIGLLAALPSSAAADFSAIWDGGNGNWSDSLHWVTSPSYPNNTGGITYDAHITNGDVILDRNITIQRLFFESPYPLLDGAAELTLNEGITWTGANVRLAPGGAINLAVGSTSTLSAPGGVFLYSGTINNAGVVTQSSTLWGVGLGQGNGIINNLAGASWTIQGGFFGKFGVFNNMGTFRASAFADCVFNNNGTVKIAAPNHGFSILGGGSGSGAFIVPAGLELGFGRGPTYPPNTYTLTSGATIAGDGSTLIFNSTLNIAGDSTIETSLSNNALITIESGATLSLTGTYSDAPVFYPAGVIRLDGGTITSKQPLNLQAGSLTGSGIVNGDINNNGTISPGTSAGALTINGNVSLLSSSKTVMEIGGLTPGSQYDYLAIAGTLMLGGTLELRMLNGFESKLNPKQRFMLVTSKSLLGGMFTNVANGARLTTADGLASFKVNYGDGSPYGADNIVLSDPLIVPEPATLALFMGGAAALALVRYRRR